MEKIDYNALKQKAQQDSRDFEKSMRNDITNILSAKNPDEAISEHTQKLIQAAREQAKAAREQESIVESSDIDPMRVGPGVDFSKIVNAPLVEPLDTVDVPDNIPVKTSLDKTPEREAPQEVPKETFREERPVAETRPETKSEIKPEKIVEREVERTEKPYRPYISTEDTKTSAVSVYKDLIAYMMSHYYVDKAHPDVVPKNNSDWVSSCLYALLGMPTDIMVPDEIRVYAGNFKFASLESLQTNLSSLVNRQYRDIKEDINAFKSFKSKAERSFYLLELAAAGLVNQADVSIKSDDSIELRRRMLSDVDNLIINDGRPKR